MFPHPTKATGLSDAEFSALMAQLGPWGVDRRVAVAVSGGADSLATAYLASRWGTVLGLIIDHGLRRESAAEAVFAAAALRRLGVPSRIIRLEGLLPGPGLAARARQARYAALTAAARDAQLLDLLLGHHALDQAETVLMRAGASSGPAGLAGMARLVETNDIRLVRPLLGTEPGRLRATLRAAGISWVEDPSNQNMAALRPRLRAGLADPEGQAPATYALLAAAGAHGEARQMMEADVARTLAQRATLFPEGFARLTPGPIDAAALAALLRALNGADFPARGDAVARLVANPRPTTLAGLRFAPAGRLGSGFLITREVAALGPPVPALPGTRWDGRFALDAVFSAPPGAVIGALGPAAAALRHLSHLPDVVLQTLPGVWLGKSLISVPHLNYPDPLTCAPMRLTFSPANPAAGALFCR
jgi:tRNA(Ile)-lysidine synthase